MSARQRPSFPVRLDSKAVTPQRAVTPRPAAPRVAVPTTRPEVPGSGQIGRPAAHFQAPAHGHIQDSRAMRAAMVKHLAADGVCNASVLSAMGAMERHRFVDSGLHAQAYEDTSLPIGWGQTISKPGVVARMIELLLQPHGDNKPGRVLEIGTGCGYQAAVLSLVVREVYSIERIRGLHEKARENLRPLRLPNVHLLFGDGMPGYARGAPYAGIIAAAGGESVPSAWLEQLAVGGRLVAPVAATSGGRQALVVIDKTPQGLKQTVLESVRFVPLKSGVT